MIPAYAEALLGHAARVLRVAPDADVADVLDAFLAAPGGASFVAASRRLAALHRVQATRRLLARHDDRLFQRGLAAVRGLAGVGPAHAEVLAALPADARTGQRLVALAQLLEVHAQLAGRAAAAFREIRRKLEAPAPPSARTWRDS